MGVAWARGKDFHRSGWHLQLQPNVRTTEPLYEANEEHPIMNGKIKWVYGKSEGGLMGRFLDALINADVSSIVDVFMVLETGALSAPTDQPASTQPSLRHRHEGGCCSNPIS
jgi:hypothetical protein